MIIDVTIAQKGRFSHRVLDGYMVAIGAPQPPKARLKGTA
jgi:hypothetical protein